MHNEQKYLPQKTFKENGPWLSCDLGFPGGSDGGKKKNLPAMQETGVRCLSWKIPWRREWLPARILAWRILWIEEPGGLQSVGLQRVNTTE